MGLTAYLDKGASLGRDAPCLTLEGTSLSYGDVQDLSHLAARALNGLAFSLLGVGGSGSGGGG